MKFVCVVHAAIINEINIYFLTSKNVQCKKTDLKLKPFWLFHTVSFLSLEKCRECDESAQIILSCFVS